jgi:hypothetical protein
VDHRGKSFDLAVQPDSIDPAHGVSRSFAFGLVCHGVPPYQNLACKIWPDSGFECNGASESWRR